MPCNSEGCHIVGLDLQNESPNRKVGRRPGRNQLDRMPRVPTASELRKDPVGDLGLSALQDSQLAATRKSTRLRFTDREGASGSGNAPLVPPPPNGSCHGRSAAVSGIPTESACVLVIFAGEVVIDVGGCVGVECD